MLYIQLTATLITLASVFYLVGAIRRHMRYQELALSKICALTNDIVDLQEKCFKHFSARIDALRQTITEKTAMYDEQCAASFVHMDYNATALKHTLICLRLFINEALSDYSEQEDYKTAQELQRLLANIDAIIEYNPQNPE